jgi:hypothetical protein
VRDRPVLQTAVNSGAVVAAVAMAADDNGLSTEGAAGDQANDDNPLTPHTMLRVASMTKMVTTVAALDAAMVFGDGKAATAPHRAGSAGTPPRATTRRLVLPGELRRTRMLPEPGQGVVTPEARGRCSGLPLLPGETRFPRRACAPVWRGARVAPPRRPGASASPVQLNPPTRRRTP